MRGLLLLLLLAGLAWAQEEPEFRQNPGAPLPRDARLMDEAGQLRFADLLRGRPLALALIYFHCPNLCGLELSDLRAAAGDQEVLAISIDPADGPADSKAARERYGSPANWRFLTAERSDLDSIERSVGFSARYDAATGQFQHPAGLVLLTPDGRVSSYLLGLGYKAEQLSTAMSEAAQGHIAAAATGVRLFCLRYDPATGRYSLAIAETLLLLGGVSVLILAGFIWREVRR